VGREKELIKVRGFQVSPTEIEAVLLTIPAVVDAAVIGIDAVATASGKLDAKSQAAVSGELVRAYLVLRPNTQLTAEEVISYASKRLAGFKRITGGVEFLPEIPKNANGKILRRVLKDIYEKERTLR